MSSLIRWIGWMVVVYMTVDIIADDRQDRRLSALESEVAHLKAGVCK